jgi:hypothetical protein
MDIKGSLDMKLLKDLSILWNLEVYYGWTILPHFNLVYMLTSYEWKFIFIYKNVAVV